MVISSDFRMGEHRDDDHEEDAPYFTRTSRSDFNSIIFSLLLVKITQLQAHLHQLAAILFVLLIQKLEKFVQNMSKKVKSFLVLLGAISKLIPSLKMILLLLSVAKMGKFCHFPNFYSHLKF